VQELAAAGMLATRDDPTPTQPTAESARELRFLNAVVHESLRCFPPATAGVARKTQREVDIAGAVVPKDSLAILPIWAVHYCTDAWGPDAGEWRPGRWLEGRIVNAVKKDRNGNPRWLPFQHGAQNCIGQHLAMVRARMLRCQSARMCVGIRQGAEHCVPCLPCGAQPQCTCCARGMLAALMMRSCHSQTSCSAQPWHDHSCIDAA
jgi:Cytochrome P450